MNKKLVIIIPNELETKNLSLFVTKCHSHLIGIKKFIYNADINLSEQTKEDPDSISKVLLDLGLIIMQVDEFNDYKNIIIYIPNEISQKQLEYFEKRKKPLSDYEVSICAKEDNNYRIIDKSSNNEINIYTAIEMLKNRLIQPNKKKTLNPQQK